MKIQYTNKRFNPTILLGIMWLIIGSANFFIEGDLKWFYCLQVFLGVFSIVAYYYDKSTQYLVIREDRIYKYSLTKKLLPIVVKSVKHVDEAYILKVGYDELIIDTQKTDQLSLAKLEMILSEFHGIKPSPPDK